MKKKLCYKLLPVILLLAVLALYFAADAMWQRDSSSLSEAEKLYGLSLIWKRSAEVYAYWQLLPELDWEQAYQEYIPRVLQTKSDYAYYQVLGEFVACLQDGHSGVYSPYAYSRNSRMLPFILGYMEGQYMVKYADPDNCPIPLGSTVTEINGLETGAFLEQAMGHKTGLHTPNTRQDTLGYLLAVSDTRQSLELRGQTPQGQPFVKRITYQRRGFNYPSFELTFPAQTLLAERDTFSAYDLGHGVYRVTLSTFANDALGAQFSEFIQQYDGSAAAFILDVRGNSGGSTFNGLAVLYHFIDPQELDAGMEGEQSYVRDDDTFNMGWAATQQALERLGAQMGLAVSAESLKQQLLDSPGLREYLEKGLLMLQNRYYITRSEAKPTPLNVEAIAPSQPVLLEQPVVVLVDWRCASAGDDFAAYVKQSPRFTLMGTNTKGTTGQLAIFELPGDSAFFISSVRCLQPDGTDYINRGVQPQIWSEQTIADALQGIDTPLSDALAYLAQHYGIGE